MGIARRGFLKLLGSAAVALTLSRTLPGIAGEVPLTPIPTADFIERYIQPAVASFVADLDHKLMLLHQGSV